MIPTTLHLPASPLLRRVLLIDALVSGATGALLIVAAEPLAPLLGLSPLLLRLAGLALVPFVLLLAWVLRRDRLSRRLVRGLVAINALWAIGSLLMLAAGWVEPTWLGYAFVAAQAAIVGLFAELQVSGARRASPAAA